ncbi:efflux transporter outer membrane subunit [Acidimangrovimonas sediminis]|uniref:efflux transporter outer membrane subunit n=1 Tax=Acidimangrovimonas sediminis TaxID=2056283 RepID=UPI001E58BF18|nr:efflux transporter outer membrane subunit [Acidimangrovimonas sediminis]
MMKPLSLVALLMVSGCAVGPNFQSPSAQLPPAYVGGTATRAKNVAYTPWWRDYHDNLLTSYIETGLSRNLDVETAQEEIVQAKAALRETGVAEAADGTATGAREKVGGSGENPHYANNSTLSASLVLDIFGGIRRDRESAKAAVAAAQDNLQVVRLQWLASMIEAYSNARYYQQAVWLTRATIKARKQTLTISENQFKGGSGTNYEVAEARATLQSAEGDLPEYMALYKSNVYAIAKLLNRPAGPILHTMDRSAHQLRTPGTFPSGIPADLLRNRPDIRYQSALLHEEVAKVGVDDADMLPSLSLAGTIEDTAGTSTWGFGPSLSLPLLNQGVLAAKRDAQISSAKQAELAWRSAVTSAVSDVQVALSNLHQYRDRSAALARSASSYGTALNLERENYRNGAITLSDLVTVDLDTTSAQISAASARNDAAQEWATLQIAIGAGAAVVGSTTIPAAQLTAVAKKK